MRILLVEDNTLIGEGLVDGLSAAGHTVDWLTDGGQAQVALADTHSFDLVVLDLGLPRMDGVQVLSNLRQRRDVTPVLILTARDSLDERVAGLNAGADDYLGKPFALAELLARINALWRRSTAQVADVVIWGNLRLDTHSQQLSQEGVAIELTAHEYKLLATLMQQPQRYFSRELLEEKLYGWQNSALSNSLDVHFSNLRRKIGKSAIVNVRNLGWRMSEDTHPPQSECHPA